ncbi:hypothetical protein KDL44_09550 [bacterium]|nr:hypothetical protein [bacterium]
MRHLYSILLSVILLLATCQAALAGYEADYTMTMRMDGNAFAGMAEQFGGMGMDGADAADIPAEMQQDMHLMHGKVYWVDGKSRIDMYYDPSIAGAMGSAGEVDITQPFQSIIIYEESGTSYTLMHNEKRAIMFEQMVPGMEHGGMMDMQPDSMIRNYDRMVADLREQEGVTVSELSPTMINGVAVKGVAFTMDMQSMMQGLEGMEGMEGLNELFSMGDGEPAGDMEGMEGLEDFGGLLTGILSMMGDMSGELWWSDELDIMMRMDMSIMGMHTSMELDSIFDWQDDGGTFSVPDEYELVTQEQYFDEQMQEVQQMMDSLPSAADGNTGSDDYYNVYEDGAKLRPRGSQG